MMRESLFIFLVALVCFSCKERHSGTLYVDAPRVFEGFNLTKELKEKTKLEEGKFVASMDSLKLALALEPNPASESYRRIAFRLTEMENARDYHLENLVNDSDEKIWNLLNGYFKEFGGVKKCDVLLAGLGNGNVLYVSNQVDVTAEFIDFANNKYEGE